MRCFKRAIQLRSGFTIMELMIVIGMLGVIAAVVVAAINPTEQLIEAQDAKRRNQTNALQKALFQYSIDAGGQLPNQSSISTDSENPTNICREGLTGSCVVFDSLVPNYLTALPVDPTETGASLTGFAVYTDTYGRANIVANYLGQEGGSTTGGSGGGPDTTNPTISSTTPTDGATDATTTGNLVIVFDETVTKQTGNITIKRSSDDATIETIDVTNAAVSVADATVTINPSADLAYYTGFYIQIDGTAFDDSSGNSFAGIANATGWNFNTDIIRDGLTHRWQLNDGTGTSATEEVAGNNGTVTNVPGGSEWASVTPAVLPQTYSFDPQGDDDRISLDSEVVLNVDAGATWAVSYWAYQTSTSDMPLGQYNTGFNRIYHSHVIRTSLDDGKYTDLTGFNPGNNLNQWVHVILQWNGTSFSGYTDGNARGTGGNFAGADTTFRIDSIGHAYNTDAFTWQGYLTDVRIYDRILTSTEAGNIAAGAG